jgi:hypothetical protein
LLSSVYEVTPEIIEWLNHNLSPLEQAVFNHYRGIQHLVRLVDKVELGRAPRYAALSALREYNARKSTSITYEEVRDRCPTYIFSDLGEWAAYMDNVQAANRILSGDFDDPMEALENAPPDINWIVLWLVSEGVVVVQRSPHTGNREYQDDEAALAAGVVRGPFPSYVLPPGIEAAMDTADPEEILYIPQNWSSHERRS